MTRYLGNVEDEPINCFHIRFHYVLRSLCGRQSLDRGIVRAVFRGVFSRLRICCVGAMSWAMHVAVLEYNSAITGGASPLGSFVSVVAIVAEKFALFTTLRALDLRRQLSRIFKRLALQMMETWKTR